MRKGQRVSGIVVSGAGEADLEGVGVVIVVFLFWGGCGRRVAPFVDGKVLRLLVTGMRRCGRVG